MSSADEAREAIGRAAHLASETHFVEAEALLREAEKIFEALDPRGVDLAYARFELADVVLMQSRFAEATTIYDQVIDTFDRELGAHPDLAHVMTRKATALKAQGKMEEFGALALRSTELVASFLDPEVAAELEPDTLAQVKRVHFTCLKNKLLKHVLDYDYDAAVELAERMIGLAREIYGPAHLEVASACSELAVVYSYRGELERAKATIADARKLFEAALSDNPRMLDVIMKRLGLAPRQQN